MSSSWCRIQSPLSGRQSFIHTVFRRYNADSRCSPKPFSSIPSPKGALPFIGHYNRIKNGLSKEVQQMYKEVNSPIFRLKLPGVNMVLTNDPSGAKDIYSAEGPYPARSIEKNLQWFSKQRNEQTSFAFESGPKWREGRSKLGKQLNPANVYGYVPGFIKATDRMIRNINEMKDSNGYIADMQELVMYWSLEVGTWFSYGADLDARLDHRSEALELKQSTEEFIKAVNVLMYSLPYYKIFPKFFLRKVNKAVDNTNRVSMMYVDKQMDRIAASVASGKKESGQSLLEQWLIEGKQTKEEAARNATGMMSAGLDTTAHLLTFMLYELSKHEEVQEKLYDQVYSVLGSRGEPDLDSLQKMPYLINIIKESQRISSVVPSHTRVLPQDSTILGYSVPAGTIAQYSLISVNQSPSVYVSPEQFNPDRWSQDNISPYASIPFGVGPRSCWGRRFAEIELKVLLAKLSQHYIMESDDSVDTRLPFEEKTIIRPTRPVKIKFIKRN